MKDNINNNDQLGGDRDFTVHDRVYDKVQAEPTVRSND